MVWTFDRTESTYSATFPQSKVTIVVEGDEWGEPDATGAYLPLKEGHFYHFELSDRSARLSKSSSFINKPASHGAIAPGTAVGYGRLYLEGAESPDLSLGIEVASEVVSYKKDYQELLQQLTEDIADLQMQCTSGVQGLVAVNERVASTNDVQQMFFILGLVGSVEFDAGVRQIFERPQVQLVEVDVETDVRSAARIGRNELRQFASAARRVALPTNLRGRCFSIGTLPERLTALRRIESADTQENRFVKYVLNTFADRLQAFRRTLKEKRKDDSSLTVMIDLEAAIKMLSRWTSHEFFKGVGPLLRMPTASVVLQRREGYREVLKKWLQYQAGTTLKIELGEDIYAANQRKMSALYEYWCFFRLLKIVARIFNIGKDELARKMFAQVGTAADGLSLMLKEGKTTTLEGSFETKVESVRYRSLKVEFAYNRTFSAKGVFGQQPSWTLPMRPDYTLTFWPATMTQEIALLNDLVTYVHFDAKYKAEDLRASLRQIGRERDSSGDEGAGQVEGDAQAKRDVKRVDILKMHAYRDAIRQTGGAYVLFPGQGVNNQSLQQSFEVLPGLGAFVMSPSYESTKEITDFLQTVARHLSDRITRWENFTYQKNLIYSGSKDEWAKHQKTVSERYAYAKDLKDDENGVRINLSDRDRLASIPPSHFLYTNIGESSKKTRGRWFQAKWIKDHLMFVRSTGQDLKGAIPENLVMIIALWMPPFSMMVKRYRGKMTRADVEHETGAGLPFGGTEFHVWDISLHNFDHVSEYLAKHPYGPDSDIADNETFCQALHDAFGGNWVWTE